MLAGGKEFEQVTGRFEASPLGFTGSNASRATERFGSNDPDWRLLDRSWNSRSCVSSDGVAKRESLAEDSPRLQSGPRSKRLATWHMHQLKCYSMAMSIGVSVIRLSGSRLWAPGTEML